MKKKKLLILLFLLSNLGHSQTATVGNPNFDVQGPLYLRQNLHTLNKTSNGWVVWGTRDTSTPQSTINFSNINNALFQGNVGIGTNSPDAKLHVENSAVSQSSTAKADANFIIQGTSSTRSTSEGAALGFVVPSNTTGSSYWQQGRILVTPDNSSNSNASGRMYLQARYYNGTAWAWRNNLVLRSSGNVGIGTTNPDMKLTVKGNIHAEEVKIDLNVPAPDYVFKKDYNLRTIEELEGFIEKNSRLPEIPSAKEFEQNGVMQAEMDMNLLKKIEELTLYTIQQQKEIESLKKENEEVKLLNTKLFELQGRLEVLERK